MRGAAAFAQAGDDRLALRQRCGQELALPRLIAYLRAERHVLDVVRALGVAVHEHDAAAGDRRHVRFGQQGEAGRLGEGGADEEVAVAAEPVHGGAAGAQRSQRSDDARVERVVEIVVAGPVFEDVAEQVEPLGMRRALGQEAEERLGRARVGRLQMQVGNEERRRARRCRCGGHRCFRGAAAETRRASCLRSVERITGRLRFSR